MASSSKYTIICVGIATLFIGLWGEMFSTAPTIIKIIYSVLLYFSLLFFPLANIIKNDFGRWANALLFLIVIDSFLLVGMTVYNTDPDMYLHGNKWLTLFLNEYTLFALFPPLFVFLATTANSFSVFSKYLVLFIVFSLLLSPIQTNSVAFLPIFFIAFLPYIKTKYRFLFVIVIIVSVLTAISRVRMLMIVNFFSFVAVILVYLFRFKYISAVFIAFCLILPFLVFVPILGLAKGELSFFQKIMEYLAQNNIISDTNDTRTLLYLEIAEDIEANKTWLFGKGAYCHYFSHYFSLNEGDDSTRTLVEVPFLYMLLKGGFFYVIPYYGLLVTAIYKGLFCGKNRFVFLSSILITGWYFNSFIGDLNGCRFYHLGFFFLVGCCLSRRVLSYSDVEIQLLFDEQFYKFKVLKSIILIKLFHQKENNDPILKNDT